MYILVVGGGKTGSYLARQLLEEGHEVKLIEPRQEIFERLKKELPAKVIEFGDGSSPAVLENCGIGRADVLVAVTGEDETNLVVSTLGKFEFKVPRTIARVNNPKNAWLFTPEMGVDVGLNQTNILIKLIAEEMSLGDMTTLLKIRRGEFSLVEEKLPEGAKAIGVSLRDLPLPPSCVIAAVIRGGKVLTPRGDMTFQADDEVLAVVDNKSLPALKELFNTEKEL